jgi:hypothetical protein
MTVLAITKIVSMESRWKYDPETDNRQFETPTPGPREWQVRNADSGSFRHTHKTWPTDIMHHAHGLYHSAH